MLQLMSYSIPHVYDRDTASVPFLCRVCDMQELSLSDFVAHSRFDNINQRFSQRGRSKHVLADDAIEVALIAELLHRGADADQADGQVSFVCNL